MKITFQVTNGDGTTQNVVAGQADLIAMERKFDVSAASLGDSPRMEHVAFVAYNAAKRQGLTDLSFDEWLESSELEEREGNS